jgi:hypothetical protein
LTAIRASGHDYDLVVALSQYEDTSVPVGAGRGVLVGADGVVVRDDTWMEVFTTKAGCIAVVQASGPDYPDILARALAYPVEDDQDVDVQSLDQGHVIPNMHPPNWRGIWYPKGYGGDLH